MSRKLLDRMCHMGLFAALLASLLSTGNSNVTLAQEKAESTRTTHRYTSRPDLAIPYDKVSRFKLATRKKEYHVGETVILAYAMLNVSNATVFFERPTWPEFSFKLGHSPEQRLPIFTLVTWGVLAANFEALEPGEVVSDSIALVVGCPGPNHHVKADGIKDSAPAIDDRTAFEHGRFGDVEQGCISSTPGTYTITAKYGNAFVVDDSEYPGILTATGSIRSEPLAIKITR